MHISHLESLTVIVCVIEAASSVLHTVPSPFTRNFFTIHTLSSLQYLHADAACVSCGLGAFLMVTIELISFLHQGSFCIHEAVP